MRINAILFEGIEQEQLRQPAQAKKASLTAENPLELDVVYKGENRLLNGHPDYSVWYDDKAFGTNLVIVEAKRAESSQMGHGQCLAYMGKLFLSSISMRASNAISDSVPNIIIAMVHRVRKEEGKKNAIVYGCCTDSYSFSFFRIDNESRVRPIQNLMNYHY